MKNSYIILSLFALVLTTQSAVAQQEVSAPTDKKGLAATMNIYAFPKDGQSASQQSKDESACYDWAHTNTGTDPFKLQQEEKTAQQQSQQAMAAASTAGDGAGAVGTIRGAAGGALIGAIAGDAGHGAAYGAAAGLLFGHHRKRMARHEAEADVSAQSAQQQQAFSSQMTNFKKAFSACLEGKNYMVKY